MATSIKQEDWEVWEGADEDQATFQKLTRHSSSQMPARSRTPAYRAVRRASRKRAGTRERFAGAHMRRNRIPLYQKANVSSDK